jgi:hypothetical protein
MEWPAHPTETCLAHMRAGGRVVVPGSRLRGVAALVGSVLFTVVCASLLVFFLRSAVLAADAEQWWATLLHPVTWASLAGVVFFGPVGVPLLIRRLLRREALVLSPRGLSGCRYRDLGGGQTAEVPWSDIAGFEGRRGPRGAGFTVQYTLTAEGQARLQRSLAAHGTRAPARTVFTVRPGFEGGPRRLLAFLTAAHASALAQPPRQHPFRA